MTRAQHEPSGALRALADELGILASYVDQTGKQTRETRDDTRRAILGAMGWDARSDAEAAASLDALRARRSTAIIDPTRVVVAGRDDARSLRAHAPGGRTLSGPWQLEIELENGERRTTEGPWRGDATLDLHLPELPLGYHTARLTLSAGGSEWRNEQTLIVVPPRCVTPYDVVGDDAVFGIVANLYTLRSRANWGVGDLSDLRSLAEWGASVGAEFVGVNPLHALLNRNGDVSPYSPLSRLFRNPIYIDVAAVPELAQAPAVREKIASSEFASELEALRESDAVQYEQVAAVKGLVLGALHDVFVRHVRGSGSERDRAYDEFLSRAEPELTRFAVWMAIAERERGCDWREWPDELREPASDAVQRFAREHAPRVEYHRWLQFEMDRQLGVAGRSARNAGMRIGLYQDLAIGTSAASADTWGFPDLFVRGMSVGAPPDPYSAVGQNWGLPPINPHALRQSGYRYFIELLRAGFRHGGALRIDHVLGLFRLFWIPEGRSGDDGAYVRSPTDDLLGILALESVRHGAIVVGEDLGTVPPEVPPTLERWGILSSKVLRFERSDDGFCPSASYPALALATADTHDMAPITGFWEGRDIELREAVGLIDAAGAEVERADRARDRAATLRLLADERILAEPLQPASPAALRGAIHGFLCRTPSRLVGLALDDIAGEREPVNVPGVGADKFPSWTRKMQDTLETIMMSDDARAALRCDGRRAAHTLTPDGRSR